MESSLANSINAVVSAIFILGTCEKTYEGEEKNEHLLDATYLGKVSHTGHDSDAGD
jgi:hypothetical protein